MNSIKSIAPAPVKGSFTSFADMAKAIAAADVAAAKALRESANAPTSDKG